MSESAAPDPGLTRRARREQRKRAKEPFASPFSPSAGAAEQGRPTILMVCTGNICRSALAEVVLRSRLPKEMHVHSAGTQAPVGSGMPDEARELAREFGAHTGTAEAHRARYLVEPILAESHLVLTMTREHRTTVVQMMPALIRRTFTLREFARLSRALPDDEVRRIADRAGADAAARLSAVARAIGERRGMAPPSDEDEDDDVIDPYRKSREVYRQSADEILPALAEVERVARLVLVSPR